jgi:hypothetical protein
MLASGSRGLSESEVTEAEERATSKQSCAPWPGSLSAQSKSSTGTQVEGETSLDQLLRLRLESRGGGRMEELRAVCDMHGLDNYLFLRTCRLQSTFGLAFRPIDRAAPADCSTRKKISTRHL